MGPGSPRSSGSFPTARDMGENPEEAEVRRSRIVATLALYLVTLSACGASVHEATAEPVAAEESETPSLSPSAVATVAATTEPADSPPAGAVDVQLGQGSVFHPSTLEVPAGEVITFFLHAPPDNQQPHNMAIREGLTVVARSAFLDGGESAVFTVVGLSPGAYRFYCEFEDHLAEGMAGDLTVAP